jgi:uncharacterized protein
MTFDGSYRISELDSNILSDSGINFMTKLIFLTSLLILLGCQSGSRHESQRNVELITPGGETIQTTVAITQEEQTQGLSGVKADEFEENQGMLFFYLEEDERHFWMPDTFFELDLFFLDKELKIIDIIRKLPFHVGRQNEALIPRARAVWSRHVLEMKSTSEIARKLKIGDQLKWKSTPSLEETDMRLKKATSTQ